MNTVLVNDIGEYNLEKLSNIFREQFKMLNVGIKSGMTVVIKPNLVIKANPQSAIITHPVVVSAVGLVVKEYGANVLIAESSGGLYTPTTTKSIFTACGYKDIAEKHGFELYTKCEFEKVKCENSLVCKEFDIVKPFINADYIINIAKLKSHCMTVFSGAVKNLFGTVPGLLKPELHMRYTNNFSDMIVDLCEYIKPDLNILDAIEVMEGDGPTGGSSRFCGLVLTSQNPYALDVVASSLTTISSEDIPILDRANKRGLCGEFEVVGADIKKFIMKDFKKPKSTSLDFINTVPMILRPMFKKLTASKPKIQTKNCIGCGKCAESCPVHTIEIKNKKAVINYKNCIKCFCCHEMCPIHIIDVKKFVLFR